LGVYLLLEDLYLLVEVVNLLLQSLDLLLELLLFGLDLLLERLPSLLTLGLYLVRGLLLPGLALVGIRPQPAANATSTSTTSAPSSILTLLTRALSLLQRVGNNIHDATRRAQAH
jgi:hypothetical protein